MSSFPVLSGVFLITAAAVAAPNPHLSTSDWASIRAAYDAGRHEFVLQENGQYAARNPGQGWITRFDGAGFTTTPVDGG